MLESLPYKDEKEWTDWLQTSEGEERWAALNFCNTENDLDAWLEGYNKSNRYNYSDHDYAEFRIGKIIATDCNFHFLALNLILWIIYAREFISYFLREFIY